MTEIQDIFEEVQLNFKSLFGRVAQLESVPTALGGGGAPIDASYLVVSLDGTLTDERNLVVNNGLDFIDNGANNSFQIDLGTPSNVTSISANGVTATSHTHALDTTGVIAGNYGSASEVATFTVDNKGRLTAASSVAITGFVEGSGTIGRVTQWATASTIEDSNLIGPAANVLTLAAGGAYTLTVPATGTAALGAGTSTASTANDVTIANHTHQIVLYNRVITVDADGTDYTTITAACAYVATQSPSAANRFLIEVLPGTYTENFTVPAYTSVAARVPGTVVVNGDGSAAVAGGYTAIIYLSDEQSNLYGIQVINTTTMAITNNVCAIYAGKAAAATACFITGCTVNIQTLDPASTGSLTGIFGLLSTLTASNCNISVRADYRDAHGIMYSYRPITVFSSRITVLNFFAGDAYGVRLIISANAFTAYNSALSANYRDIDLSLGSSASLYFTDLLSNTSAGIINQYPVASNTGYGMLNLALTHQSNGFTLQSAAAAGLPFTLKGAALQTGNLLLIKNSSDATMFFIDANGTPSVTDVRTTAGVLSQLNLTGLGSGANGDGGAVYMQGSSSTDPAQDMARMEWLWDDATHASRKADLIFSAWDTAQREGMRIRGMGSEAGLSFYGGTPVVRGASLTTQLTTITFTAPGTPDYAIQDLTAGGFGFVTKDEGNTVLSVIANLQARVAELEARLNSTTGVNLIA